MQEKGIELLISHDTANMNYLTGYDAWSFYYAQAVIVHVNADEPLCWVRKQDSGGAYIKTYLKNENILVYDEKYIHTWPLHPYDNLVEIIKERKWDKLSIGLKWIVIILLLIVMKKLNKVYQMLNLKILKD
jgi:Xaa-Pro dipeptidase/ectoine hydrolase